ncbi:MAG: class I SAM-dependent methyltransferase [Vicinamibacterales bacterium]
MTDAVDPLAEFKASQRTLWASFAPTATFTTPIAARLVSFAGITPGAQVLDVGTGTGVVAVTAARAGAQVTGLDLTPALLEHARENAQIAGVSVNWQEGDAERLPFPDATFDIVVSQFGHMFAPRPELAVAEMRRVLKPGGRVAFSTWPPEHFVGRMFALMARYAPPPPPGVSAPPLWGNPAIVTERLAEGFDAPFFSREVMYFPALSLGHFRAFMEQSIGPMQKTVHRLESADPKALATLRAEFETLATPYFTDNQVHQHYLLTRAQAR